VCPKQFLSLWYIRCKSCANLVSRLALYQMNWIKHPLELCHLGVLSGASKTIFEPTICLAQTVHLSYTNTNTISKWTKRDAVVQTVHLSYPRHLRVPSGVSKTISDAVVHLAQTVHLSWVKISTIFELPLETRDLGVPSGASKMISKPVVHSAQTVLVSCVKFSTISNRTELSFHLSVVS
jgi:hypothetical protein